MSRASWGIVAGRRGRCPTRNVRHCGGCCQGNRTAGGQLLAAAGPGKGAAQGTGRRGTPAGPFGRSHPRAQRRALSGAGRPAAAAGLAAAAAGPAAPGSRCTTGRSRATRSTNRTNRTRSGTSAATAGGGNRNPGSSSPARAGRRPAPGRQSNSADAWGISPLFPGRRPEGAGAGPPPRSQAVGPPASVPARVAKRTVHAPKYAAPLGSGNRAGRARGPIRAEAGQPVAVVRRWERARVGRRRRDGPAARSAKPPAVQETVRDGKKAQATGGCGLRPMA